MEYKYYISDSVNPYENLALEQCLFRAADRESAVLYLWQNDRTIVAGRNQNIFAECRAEEFLAEGGRIARRHSGGGTVYHDLGNLNFSLISRDAAPETVDYRRLVADALADFGVAVESNGRNDLLAGGRKISGSAAYHDGAVLCRHGTILVSADTEKMAYYLTPDKSKLDRNHVSSVSARVTNLSELSGEITIEKVRAALIRAAGALPLWYSPEQAELKRRAAFFESRRWIFGGET